MKRKEYFKRIITSVVLVVLVLGLTVAMSVYMYRRTEQECWEGLKDAAYTEDRMMASLVDNTFQSLENISTAFTMHDNIASAVSAMKIIDSMKVGEMKLSPRLYLPNGRAFTEWGILGNVSAHVNYDEILEAMGDRGRYISCVKPDYLDRKKKVLEFFLPVKKNGEIVAIVSAVMELDKLPNYIRTSIYEGHANVLLYDLRDGMLFMDTGHRAVGKFTDYAQELEKDGTGRSDFLELINSQKETYTTVSSEDGADTLYIYSVPSRIEGWSTVISVSKATAFQKAIETTRLLMLFVVAELLIYAAYLFLTFRSIKKEIEEKTRFKQEQLDEAIREKGQISVLADNLSAALRQSYPLVILMNVTENRYYMLEYGRDANHTAAREGEMDELIRAGASTIPDAEQAAEFERLFSRKALIQAYAQGETRRLLRHKQYKDDGGIQWMESICMLTELDGVLYEITLARNVDAEVRAEEEARARLEDAYRRAEAASVAKSNFLFNMSHDIRTPLNAITGFIAIAERNENNKEKLEESLKKVKLSSERLIAILDNVLEMARIENGKVKVQLELMDTEKSFAAQRAVFEQRMEEKKISFTLENHIIHRYIYTDETLLSEIFMNLLSNACKYTPEGGSIRVVANEYPADNPDECIQECIVEDTGIGMSEEFLKHAFDEFQRERTSQTTNIQGTGLGLAIVKKYTDLLGATIEVESELGKGSRFTVRGTYKIGKAPEEQDVKKEEKSLEEYIELFRGKRILLAEDQELNAEIAINLLEYYGFTVDRAANGMECIQMLDAAPAGTYHIILMDIQMPVMDGYRATHEIRSMRDRQKAQIPIIALSANAFREDVEKSLAEGMDGHQAKPLDVQSLMSTLEQFV